MKFSSIVILGAVAVSDVSAWKSWHHSDHKRFKNWGQVQIKDLDKGETVFSHQKCPMSSWIKAMWKNDPYDHTVDGSDADDVEKVNFYAVNDYENDFISRVFSSVKRFVGLRSHHHFGNSKFAKIMNENEKKTTKTYTKKNQEHHDSPFYSTDPKIEADNKQNSTSSTGNGIPTAMFHGFGDACIMPGDIHFDSIIKEGTGGYIKCIEVGIPSIGEVLNNFETIAQKSCLEVASNTNFQGEFNVIGLSQGGLLARYIAEECEMPGKVRNMATLGGPHMGVDAVPGCFDGFFCNILNKVVKKFVYMELAQNFIAPAGYFRDVNNMATYLKSSVFLPVVNNEISQTSKFAAVRKGRLSELNSIMLGMFSKDSVIYPKETAWFQQNDLKGNLLPLNATDFYNDDYIGLKAMNDAKKVQWISFDGDHLQFTTDDIKNKIVPFLNQ